MFESEDTFEVVFGDRFESVWHELVRKLKAKASQRVTMLKELYQEQIQDLWQLNRHLYSEIKYLKTLNGELTSRIF